MRKITLKKVAINHIIEILEILQKYATGSIIKIDYNEFWILLRKDIATQLTFKFHNHVEKNQKETVTIQLKIAEAVVLYQILTALEFRLTDYTKVVANKYKDIIHQELTNII